VTTTARGLFSSAAWNHIGKVLEYVLLYSTSILIARSLGVEENGRFVGLFSVSQLLLVLCSFGLEVSLNKHIPQLQGSKSESEIRFVLRRLLLIRAMAFAAAASVALVCFFLIEDVFPSNVEEYLFLLLGYTAIGALVSPMAMVLTAQLRTLLNARITISIKAVELAGVVALSIGGISVASLFVLFISTGLLQLLAYLVFAKSNLLGEEQPIDVKPIITFGSIYWVNTIVDYFLGRHGDVLLLVNILPDSSQASLYDVAYSIIRVALLGMTVGMSGVTFATFAKLASGSRDGLDRFYGFMVRMNSLLTIPIFAFLLFHAAPVVHLLYSSGYDGATKLAQGMAGFLIASRLFAGAENAEYLLSIGHVAKVVGIGVMAALTNIVLNILLIPRLESMGSVVASGVSNLLVNAMGAILVLRISGGKLQVAYWTKIVIVCCGASWLSGVLIASESTAMFFVQVFTYAISVLGLLALTKPLTTGDVAWLSGIDGRLAVPLRLFTRSTQDIASGETR